MDNQQYVDAAHQTLSDKFCGELVSMLTFKNSVDNAIKAMQALDTIKRALFYGKEIQGRIPSEMDCTHLDMGLRQSTAEDPIALQKIQNNILHAIIGKATEAGELLEALQAALHAGGNFDFFNAVEEVGDGMWYDAILLRAVNSTIDHAQEKNIAKLRARFPQKFTAFDALNRDLGAERQVLEA